jgi:hypothetical protein
MTDEQLDAYIDANAVLLGLTIAPEWRAAVRDNLRVTLRMGAMVDGFALPDELEHAPVFRA